MFNSKKIIVFGTSQVSEIIINSNIFDIAYVIDNYKENWGKTFHNKLIYSPMKIIEENLKDILVLLTFSPSGEVNNMVSKQLVELGLIENQHFVSIYDVLPNSYPYQKITPLATYSPWKSDYDFQQTYTVIKNNTLVDIYRCFELWSLVQQVSHLEGALIEIGTWKGGTGGLIAKSAELSNIKDTIYLCDTFSGVVKANPEYDNVYKGGEHSDTNEDIVNDLIFNKLKLNNVSILKGIFPDETHSLIKTNLFRFCHIDVDVFESARDIFDWVWDRMVIGGVVVFDDYGFITCQGITNYVNELSKKREAHFLHNLNGHGVLIKIK